MSKVAIIGAGLVGRAWAISFARGGCEVFLFDHEASQVDRALAYVDSILGNLEINDLLNGESPQAVRRRMRKVDDVRSALADAVHVQENVPEELEIKRKLHAELDTLAGPDAVLASSTSALLPSSIFEGLGGARRCLVVHPINPPYLIPAVEVVPSPWTDAEIVKRTVALMRNVGQAPIVMRREIDGFVMNRMQGALLEEAFRLVADGYASSEDVDIGLREGLALRWSFMGPFETIDLNAPGGVADYVRRYQQIYERLFPSMQRRVDWAGDVLKAVESDRRARLASDKLGERARWRDLRLMALLAHKRRAANDIGS
jgi:3-hydroxyacyl-CoA dehydrogenase